MLTIIPTQIETEFLKQLRSEAEALERGKTGGALAFAFQSRALGRDSKFSKNITGLSLVKLEYR